MYKKMIEEARAKGFTSEKVMNTAIDDVQELLCAIKELHPELYWDFIKHQHEKMFGCHYNEVFGVWRIEQMHWKDKTGAVHHAPHWTKEQQRSAYESVKSKLPSTYNCWDFAVTLEMLYSDLVGMYERWWPDATDEQIEAKIVESAVNYLNDDDDMDCKIWHRFEK